MRRASIPAHVPRPLHGGLDLAHGGGRRAGDVPEAGRVLSDAQDEGVVPQPSVSSSSSSWFLLF